MDIRQLKYFVAVAEKLSFTEAAKSLFVAQSAVSQQISELEKKMGILLFNRTRRSVKLTPAGNVLYCEATGLLKRLDEVKEITRNAHLGYKGHLRIGFIGYGDRTCLPSIFRDFQSEFPDVTLEINSYHQGELIKALNEDTLDLVVTFSFGLLSPDENRIRKNGIETHHIYTETLSAVVACDSDLAKIYDKKALPLKALAKEPFIIQNRHESPQGFDKTLQLCSYNGFSPRILTTPNSVQTVLMLVDAHMGVAILPSSIKDYAGPNLKFLSLDMDVKNSQYDIVAAWKNNSMNPSLKHLIAVIKTNPQIL